MKPIASEQVYPPSCSQKGVGEVMVHVPKGVLGWLLLLSHKNCMILEQRWNCIHITEDLFIIIYGDGIMQSDCPFQRISDESVNSPARGALSDSRTGLDWQGGNWRIIAKNITVAW